MKKPTKITLLYLAAVVAYKGYAEISNIGSIERKSTTWKSALTFGLLD